LKFYSPITNAITSSVSRIWRMYSSRYSEKGHNGLWREQMDTLQVKHALRNVPSFLWLFPSDVLPLSMPSSGTKIINVDRHTEGSSHWLAINFQTKRHSALHFDSYALYPFVPAIIASFMGTVRSGTTTSEGYKA
jgi:hypothetical protein